ncbi:hypothetical protein Cgig2_026034 [Carnegiea gigantea]|uniref:F-box protein At3g26010-like beta-propeller domain-containing protein n=1 Tax=Carnegiea gigantea TaxID=171969 RepID=A0A9Q1QKK1_9CARY|nr:hypothetical protein Cgig2_026034 [Carnegiea gigantea]
MGEILRVVPSITLRLWPPPIVYNGKLHFLDLMYILAFDPFRAKNDRIFLCRVIDFPVGVNMSNGKHYLGACSGSLRFCTTHRMGSASHLLKVWDLKDYNKVPNPGITPDELLSLCYNATDFGKRNHVEKLSDGLFIEILSGIPSYESAIRYVEPSGGTMSSATPRTKQWVWLPPLRHFSTIRPKLALVCDPFYSFHSDNGKCCLQDRYRYRVISVSHAGFCLERPVDVFSFETGQWSKLGVSCPEGLKGCFDFGVPPVVYNRMLHYLHSSSIMAFDPFVSEKDSVVACRVIDLPMAGVELPKFCCLGTCSECLRLSIGQRIDRAKFMSAWHLEEYGKGEWCLKHQCSLEDLKVSCSTHLCRKFDDMHDIDILRVLGFHPYDKNILSLLFSRFVVV